LSSTLRYKLGLTGTKLGCDRAECAAGTVLVDEIPYYSCSVLTRTVRDRKVLAIEALIHADGTLHPACKASSTNRDFHARSAFPASQETRRKLSSFRDCSKLADH
jgi:aerobic-type carbon monoxide dehydrogenase small subunit (CoxS/CutS family)